MFQPICRGRDLFRCEGLGREGLLEGGGFDSWDDVRRGGGRVRGGAACEGGTVGGLDASEGGGEDGEGVEGGGVDVYWRGGGGGL